RRIGRGRGGRSPRRIGRSHGSRNLRRLHRRLRFRPFCRRGCFLAGGECAVVGGGEPRGFQGSRRSFGGSGRHLRLYSFPEKGFSLPFFGRIGTCRFERRREVYAPFLLFFFPRATTISSEQAAQQSGRILPLFIRFHLGKDLARRRPFQTALNEPHHLLGEGPVRGQLGKGLLEDLSGHAHVHPGSPIDARLQRRITCDTA